MKLVAGTYISEVVFEKNLNGSYDCFQAKEGLNKNILFGGYEENGKFIITSNRKGLERSVNGENRVIQIEKYITELFNINNSMIGA